MPGPTPDLPPEVPEQFGEAYRKAYEEALAASAADPAQVASEAVDDLEHTQAVSLAEIEAHEGSHGSDSGSFVAPAPGVVPPAGSHRSAGETPAKPAKPSKTPKPKKPKKSKQSKPRRQAPRPHWFVPVLVVLLALVLILIAYLVGRIFADGIVGDEAPGGKPSSAAPVSPGAKSPKPHPATGMPYQGAVDVVRPTGAQASCTSAPGVDAAGHRVAYDVTNVNDGDAETAWRCDGTAMGQTLTFELPKGVSVGEVALIPGYAKTDPKSGVDRYAQNNLITKVRWIFADGTTVDQTMKPDPKDRSLRVIRVPAVEGSSLKLQVLEVTTGKRNTTAISEVRIGAVG